MPAEPVLRRDAAVDAILTAETLFGQFTALVPRLTSLLPADVSVAIGEAQVLYPELWANLDRARGLLRERGVDVPVFDEARARQPAAMLGVQVHTREHGELAEAASIVGFLLGGVAGAVAANVIDGLGAKRGEANRSGLRDARGAIDALRAAMPEVDWKTVRRGEAREAEALLKELARARHKKMLFGLIGLAVAVLLGIGLVVLLTSARPPTPEEAAAQERQEFRDAEAELRELNSVLRETPCDAPAAERRVRICEARKRTQTARKLAKQFLDKCGAHAYLRSVVDAPL